MRGGSAVTGGDRLPTSGAALDRLLHPKSIAVVGATENSFWARSLVANLREHGYGGAVHLVNPRYAQQFGRTCYPSVRQIPGPVDCAYVMTGIGAVESVLDDCAAKGIRYVTVLTSGYRETGAEGLRREEQLVARCRERGITLLGPNCLGFINVRDRIVAYALPITPPLVAGPIAVVTQSGAMLQHIQRYAQQRNIGLAYLVSIGNEAMLDAVDCLDYLLGRPEIRVVAALLEGIRQAGRFIRVARRALELSKPLLLLKVGRSPASSRVAQAHTGAMAGSWPVLAGVCRQFGIVTTDTLEEMLETAALLAYRGWPRGRRTAIVAPSGGACGLLADLAAGTRIELPDFSPPIKEELGRVLPPFGTPQNPQDTTGYVVLDASLLARCVEVAARDPAIDCLLVVADPPREPGPTPERTEARLRLLAETLAAANKFAHLTASIAGELTPYGRDMAMRYGLHFGNGLPLSLRALDRALAYAEGRQKWLRRGGFLPGEEGGPGRPRPVTGRAGGRGAGGASGRRGVSPEWHAKQLLRGYGIHGPREAVVQTADEAVAIAREFGFPVVVKIQSPDIPHKTEVGGVRTGLRDEAEVRQAFEEVVTSARAHRPDARIEGVLVAEHLQPVAELIAGVVIDEQFGPAVLVGSGGILAEFVGDFTVRLAPIDRVEAEDMLAEVRASRLLQGFRGGPAGDIEAAAECLVRLGTLAVELGDRIVELDVNPLFVLPRGRGVVAADALVVWADEMCGGGQAWTSPSHPSRR